MDYIIGLDIGGTKCAVVLGEFSSHIDIVDKIKFPTETDKGFEYTKNNLFKAVYDIMDNNNLKNSDITAIGVSCGGPLNSKTGMILSPPNLPGWDNIPFVEMLEDEFGIPSFIQNDANACALVEWKLGAGKGSENMMFLTMGTGMGGGIIAEGHLIIGPSNMAGEVGHIRIEDDGPLGFGKHGSFEGFCSGAGIAKVAKDRGQKALDEGQPLAWAKNKEELESLDTKKLGEFAKAGDQDARDVFSFIGEKLGKGVSYFIDILNPEVIVIGSIFGRCEEFIRPSMEKIIDKECIPYSKDACKVAPAGTGEQIGDLASIMTAAYGLGLRFDLPDKEEVYEIYERLFQRYPELEANKDSIWKAYETFKRTYQNKGKILACGNGGSAADADHIVGELMKGFEKKRPVDSIETRTTKNLKIDKIKLVNQEEKEEYIKEHLQGALPAISLCGHNALITAISNDTAADMIYAQQVYGYGNANDTLIGITTSGNSANVVNAAYVAKKLGLNVIGLTGGKDSDLSNLADVTIQVPGETTAEIQEFHLPVYHTLCAMIEAEFYDQ